MGAGIDAIAYNWRLLPRGEIANTRADFFLQYGGAALFYGQILEERNLFCVASLQPFLPELQHGVESSLSYFDIIFRILLRYCGACLR